MNGLEAIKAMMEGKVVYADFPGGRFLKKINDGNIVSKRIEEPEESWDITDVFDLEEEYEEYISPKPGWDRKEGERYYYVDSDCYIFDMQDNGTSEDNRVYDKANYFKTVEKAKEINFKQELFRRIQRFSDKYSGSEIDWTHEGKRQFFISYDYDKGEFVIDSHLTFRDFGGVYFVSYGVAKRALETFKEDLIKYFTHDWSEGE